MRKLSQGRFHAFQPYLYMFKDFIDTFRPYKSRWYIVRDLKQCWLGIINLYQGLREFGGGVRRFKAGAIFHGMNNAIRGVTQIATAILTLALRIPLRMLLTAIFGYTKVEQNRGMQKVVKDGLALSEKVKRYNHEIALIREKKRFKGAAADYLATHFPKLTAILTRDIPTMTDIISKDEALVKDSPTLILSMKKIDGLLYKKLQKATKERQQATDIQLPPNFELLTDIKTDYHTGVIADVSKLEEHLQFFTPHKKKKRPFSTLVEEPPLPKPTTSPLTAPARIIKKFKNGIKQRREATRVATERQERASLMAK